MALMKSMYHQLVLLILAHLLSLTTGDPLVSYKELQQLNVSCAPSDTCCIDNGPVNLNQHTCECGEHCKKYRTCCVDSPCREFQDEFREEVECYSIEGTGSAFFTVTKCHPKWRGDPNIKNLCESKSDSMKDPLAGTPATNSKSGMVYKNFFCAMCNDDVGDLTMWNILVSRMVKPGQFSQSATEEYKVNLLKNMVYNEARNEWGFFSGRRYEMFEPLLIHFLPPRGVEHLNRNCILHLISDCDDKWTDEVVRKKCHAYMAAVRAPKSGDTSIFRDTHFYRNIHCAICNYADIDEAFCMFIEPGAATGGPVSFPVLVDVSRKDGSFVARVDPCKEDEWYDKHFDKCRKNIP